MNEHVNWCWFCGSLKTKLQTLCLLSSPEQWKYWVECPDCLAKGPLIEGQGKLQPDGSVIYPSTSQMKYSALYRWNNPMLDDRGKKDPPRKHPPRAAPATAIGSIAESLKIIADRLGRK